MGILEDYEVYFNKYQKIYGPQTIVLMQNGMFFEMYGIDNEIEKVGLVKEIATIINIQWTRRNKSIAENNRSNCLMAGFPCNSLDRYMAMLTDEYNYVVVVIEQITPAPNPKRAITNIVGPGTNIKYLSKPNSSYLVAIYIECEGKKINTVKPINMITVGLSAIDVSTGQTIVYQVCNSLDDENRALDEAYRFIRTLDPKEIIINSRNLAKTNDELLAYLDVNHLLVHCNSNSLPSDYYKLSYQNDFLSKIFKTGMLKPIEYLNMEYLQSALISYISLLDFCYNQNETLISQIDIPIIWNENNHLILDNNCVNQLNLVSTESRSGKHSSVYDLINQTSTAIGRRLLKDMLLMPLIDKDVISKRYDYIEYLREPINLTNQNQIKKLNGHENHYRFQSYEIFLKNISDIQRYHRKICLGILQPCEFNQLHTSYQNILALVEKIDNDDDSLLNQLLTDNLRNSIIKYMSYYQTILNLEETNKYNINTIEGSFFNTGYNQEIDGIQKEIDDCNNFFKELAKSMSGLISTGSENLVTYEYSETHGYFIGITAARHKTLLSKYTKPIIVKLSPAKTYQVEANSLDIFNKTNNGKNYKITNELIKSLSNKAIDANKSLNKKVVEVYRLFLGQLYQEYNQLMKQLVKFVGYMDVYKSNAKTSLLFNYCRPNIIESEMSSVKAIQIRHPLIERFQDMCKYIPQDIDFSAEHRGILLYGTNCSGKSSLMKAVGIATVMAQAGLYVPASEFVFRPYKTLLTRIIGNDNLFKGQSSFGVEMSELRGIIKRANQHSLVLGDEICHGTETISGVSIVAASVITLAQANSNFLFATHLHQLSQTQRVIDLKNVRMFHLKVKYDEKTGDLIYDRRLEEGPGHPIYGLEVARAMELDRKFIDLANEIRKEVMEVTPLASIKKSKYNAEIYMNKCGIPECQSQAIDTHHIKFQSMANDKGFIDHLQKNHKSNLIPLCKPCHQIVHCNQIGQKRYQINGYLMTTTGPQLSYDSIINTPENIKNLHVLDLCHKTEDPVVFNQSKTIISDEIPVVTNEKKKLVLKKQIK